MILNASDWPAKVRGLTRDDFIILGTLALITLRICLHPCDILMDIPRLVSTP